eukprot:300839-Rhodomonas_salina.3
MGPKETSSSGSLPPSSSSSESAFAACEAVQAMHSAIRELRGMCSALHTELHTREQQARKARGDVTRLFGKHTLAAASGTAPGTEEAQSMEDNVTGYNGEGQAYAFEGKKGGFETFLAKGREESQGGLQEVVRV